MEKALGMKFPLTTDSFKPNKRVNRWNWRTKARIQMEVRCKEEEDVSADKRLFELSRRELGHAFFPLQLHVRGRTPEL